MAASVPASLLLDRFVSASSADDAVKSLDRILDALQQQNSTNKEGEEMTAMDPELIWSDDEILKALRHLLHTGQHKHHDMLIPVEEGSSLVCRIYLKIMEQAPKSPLLQKDTALLESVIDVISNDNVDQEEKVAVSMYTRVLALQLLTKLCVNDSSKAQAQLLQAPNGLHRLGDLLQLHQEEIIRNEALLLAQVIAEWPSCAKIWMFSEVGDQVILLALQEGGLTGGNLLVQDCLDLLFNLWKHDPQNLADLVFQSPTLASNLPRLLDLRLGKEFINPPKKKPVTSNKDDDLDALLMSANETKADKPEDIIVPHLTQQEEQVIQKTLDILALLLESDTLKKSVWKRQIGLCSLLWELALVSPPPPQVPFVCAVPSPQLQQKALETAAMYFHDVKTMERHSGLDRLLYLVCTGGLGRTLEEKMGISQAALHVIRKTVSEESVNQMLMYTLAPPMTMEDDNDDGQQQPAAPPPPTVVHKLLNTVAENLTDTEGIDLERRKIFLAGALGGLSVFLTDQTSREVMLRLTTTKTSSPNPLEGGAEESEEATTRTSLVESILHAVGDIEESGEIDPFISMTLLRFLCHWTMQTPSVAQALLSSNQSSIVLSMLLSTGKNRLGVAVLGKLLLGLAMDFMGDDEAKCGGWTRASMMDLISKKSGGVSKFTSSLEQFKAVREFDNNMPWSVCDLEFKVWAEWYSDSVLLVRKRVVQELTGSGDADSEEENEEAEGETPESAGRTVASAKSLQKVVFQQSQEIDELQQSMVKANSRIESQEAELTMYKRRVESAPSQLDNMLNEYSSKTSELELKVATLEEEKSAQDEKHQQDLSARDAQIEALRKELDEAKAREQEARDETDSLRGEIGSLSQAYTSLEEEYRQQQQRATPDIQLPSTPSGQQPGEQEGEAPQTQQSQSQPLASPGPGSTELSALRSENARLRKDAQAADEWMSMAVGKIAELGEQNVALQAQLTQLRENQQPDEQLELQRQQFESLTAENQSRIHQLRDLEGKFDNANQNSQQLQDQLNQTRDQCIELDRQLLSAREELQSCQAALENVKAQAKHDHEGFDKALDAAQTEATRLAEIVDTQQQQSSSTAASEDFQAQLSAQIAEQQALLKSKDEELDQLRLSLEQQSAAPEPVGASEQMEALNATTESLKLDLERAREDLESVRRREQEEIYKREARIRELEARVSSGTGGGAYTVEDIKQRDDEIAELQAANETAQDWMQKAVEHHQMLSQQHAKACSENASLSAQLKELRARAAQNEAAVARAFVLESESSMQAGELRNLQAAMTTSEEELNRLRSEVSTLREQLQRSETLLQDREAELRAEVDAKIASEGELVKSKGEVEKLTIDIENLQKEVDGLRAKTEPESANVEDAAIEWGKRVADLECTVESLQKQISEQEQEASADNSKWQESCVSLENKNAELAEALKVAETQQQSTQSTKEVGEESLGALQQRLEESEAALKEANEKIADDEGVVAEWEKRVADLESTIKDLECQLSDQEQEANEAITKWQQSCIALEERNTQLVQSLEAQNDDATAFFNKGDSADSMKQKVEELETELEAAREKIREDDDVIVKWEEQVAQLESTVKNLELQLAEQEENANRVIAKWQESCSALEEKNTELLHSLENQEDHESFEFLKRELREAEVALEEARSKLAEQEVLSKQSHDQIAELKAELEDLQTQLSVQEAEANDAIAKWQESFDALEATNSHLAQSLEAARNDKSESDKRIASIQMQLNESESALIDARTKLEQDQRALREGRDRIVQLESANSGLKAALSEQQDSIAKWQAGNSALEDAKATLEAEYEQTQVLLRESDATLADTKENLRLADLDLQVGKARIAELEASVSGLETQLSEQEVEAKGVIEQWEEQFAAVESTNAGLAQSLEAAENDRKANEVYMTSLQNQMKNSEEALSEAQKKLEDDETVLVAWQDRVTDLESTVKDLEKRLQEQEVEAGNAITKWQETCTSLEEKNSELAESLDASAKSHEGGRTSLEEKVASIQSQLTASEDALAVANQKIASDESILAEWQRRVGELETALKDTEQQLHEQEEEASNVIAQWEESYRALQESNAGLAQSLEAATAASDSERAMKEGLQVHLKEAEFALGEARQKLADSEQLLEEEQKRVTELESTVQDLEQQMNSQEKEAQTATSQWQESCAALEKKNAALTESLDASTRSQEEEHAASEERFSFLQTKLEESKAAFDAANKKIATDNEALAERQIKCDELESTVKELRQQLKEQDNGTNKAIAQWQESYSVLEKEVGDLQEKLDSMVQSRENELTATSDKVAHLETHLQESRLALDEAKEKAAADEETLVKWQTRCDELESTAKELEQQLDESSRAIAQWQESYNAIENEVADLKEQLESTVQSQEGEHTTTNEKVTGLETQLQESRLALDEAKEKAAADEEALLEWQTRCNEFESTVKELEQQLQDQYEESSKVIVQWQESYTALEEANTDLQEKLKSSSASQEHEHSASIEKTADLEKHLQEAKDALAAANEKIAANEDLLSKSQSRLDELELQLTEQEKEANEAIAQWEDSYRGLEGKHTELTKLHDAVVKEKQELLDRVTELEASLLEASKSPLEQTSERDGEGRSADELEGIVNALQQHLLEQEKEASTVKGKLQHDISLVEAKNAELQQALNDELAKTEDRANSAECNKVLQTGPAIDDGWEDDLLDDKLMQDVELDEGALRDLEGKAKEWESIAKKLEEDLDKKTKEMASAVAEWQDHCSSLEAQSAELTRMLEEAQTKRPRLSESEDNDAVIEELEDRIYGLEAQNKDLENELDAKHNEAAEVVANWQESYAALQIRFDEISQELEQARSTVDSTDTGDGEAAETANTKIGELEATVEELETRCAEKDKELAAAAAHLEEALNEQDAAAASKPREAIAIDEYQGDSSKEVDTAVEELKRELEAITKERDDLCDAISTAQQKIESTQSELENAKAETAHAQQTIESIQAEFENAKVESAHIVEQWTSRVKDLEAIVHDVEHQLETQTSAADEAIASWETRCAELDQKLAASLIELETSKEDVSTMNKKHADDIKALEEELLAAESVDALDVSAREDTSPDEEALTNRISELESHISEGQAAVAQMEADLAGEREETERLRLETTHLEADRLEAVQHAQTADKELAVIRKTLTELEAEKARIEHIETEAALTAEKLLETEQYQELDAECQKLRSEKLALDRDRDELSKLAGELEAELREANDAMHIFRTQAASNRATEMAAQTMRQQLDEIRKQADDDRSALKKERGERAAVEREVARLRADLVALLDMNDQENDLDAVTMKAAGKIHARERSEITELRDSLSRALDELITTRNSEKLSQEKAAKASLQLTRCEQELLSAKSDLNYLIQTMDEMREAEDSRRAALAHRISTLENEHEVLRRFHTSETESLKNELTQAMMERDQLLSSLKESEKSNTAVAAAKSRANDGLTENSLVDEVLKLRVEKAQLLVAAAEEGARTERRLREIVATQASGTEADLLVERERRLAAEASVENLKLLVKELEVEVRSKKRTSMQVDPSQFVEMERNHQMLQSENKKLMEENSSLRSKLDNADKAKERAHYDTEKLKEECRMAQAKAHRLDRDARFHNDVKTEMSRLRTPEKRDILVQVDPAEDKKSEEIFQAAEVYDMMQKQADAIQTEREMYRALCEEQDHLLQLLSLHDIERNRLHKALAGAAGVETVRTVVKESQDYALETLGAFVPLGKTRYSQ